MGFNCLAQFQGRSGRVSLSLSAATLAAGCTVGRCLLVVDGRRVNRVCFSPATRPENDFKSLIFCPGGGQEVATDELLSARRDDDQESAKTSGM